MSNPPLKTIRDLGLRVERAWLASGYDADAFAEIAHQALDASAPENSLGVDDVCRWALGTLELPKQEDVRGSFGNPPLTLYRGREFYISLLFWVDGTTSIHQHAFAGAFRVFSGSSLHTQYRFEGPALDGQRIQVGRVAAGGTRLLKRGDSLSIPAGSGYIHSLFHLDRPSATIVVRTDANPARKPQYEYYPPSLALASFTDPVWLVRQLQVVRLLKITESDRLGELVADLIASSDPFGCFRVLSALRTLANRSLFSALLERARERHGQDYGDALVAAFESQRRIDFVVACRTSVWEPDLRFFLALLMNVERKTEILNLVARYRPGAEPVDTVVDWLIALSTPDSVAGALGVKVNRLGLPLVQPGLRPGLRALLAADHPRPNPEDGELGKIEAALRSSLAFSRLF